MAKRYSEACCAQQAGMEIGLGIAASILKERAAAYFLKEEDRIAEAMRHAWRDMEDRRKMAERLRDTMWAKKRSG